MNRQDNSIKCINSDNTFYKVAKYVNLVIKNTDRIDEVKKNIFHQNFSMDELFSCIDVKNKGYATEADFLNLIKENGANGNALKLQKVLRYFGSALRINKSQFLKAVALPPWKISGNNNPILNKETLKKNLFKLLITIYLTIEEDDVERNKIADIDFEEVFKYISSDGVEIRIDQLASFLLQNKFKSVDNFSLLRFMHNNITLTYQDFINLFKNTLPQRFQLRDVTSTIIGLQKKADRRHTTTQKRLKKKLTTDSELGDLPLLSEINGIRTSHILPLHQCQNSLFTQNIISQIGILNSNSKGKWRK